MKHDMTCRCGQMGWQIDDNAAGRQLICYCADCQAAQRHFDPTTPGLDKDGGTLLRQTLPSAIQIARGAEHLALLRLGPKGLFRWHAGCCGTAIANTLPKAGFAFASAALPPGDARFGPVRARVQTAAAHRPIKSHGTFSVMWAVIFRAIGARLRGTHRDTPFFDAKGQPVAEPQVLSLEARQAATRVP